MYVILMSNSIYFIKVSSDSQFASFKEKFNS